MCYCSPHHHLRIQKLVRPRTTWVFLCKKQLNSQDTIWVRVRLNVLICGNMFPYDPVRLSGRFKIIKKPTLLWFTCTCTLKEKPHPGPLEAIGIFLFSFKRLWIILLPLHWEVNASQRSQQHLLSISGIPVSFHMKVNPSWIAPSVTRGWFWSLPAGEK